MRSAIPDLPTGDRDISMNVEKLFTVKNLPVNFLHAESVENYLVERIMELKKLEASNLQIIEQQKTEIARLNVIEENKTVRIIYCEEKIKIELNYWVLVS